MRISSLPRCFFLSFYLCSPGRSEDEVLRPTLQSLACGKKKVLKKRPAGKDVNDDDVFVFNNAFEDPRAKVHINTIQVKETVSAATLSASLFFSKNKIIMLL